MIGLDSEVKKYIKEKTLMAFVASKEKINGYSDFKSYCDYLFLDSSNIFERCEVKPYPKILIDTCIELCLYRDGFHKTAEEYRKILMEEK